MQAEVSGESRRVSDRHAEQRQGGRRTVQERTFTRWMNVFLHRCDPPLEVHDLFTDVQDGRILMALLEELSGCKLLYRFRSSSHRIFRLNNISKALAFLDDRHVKLLGIDASGVADGVPSVVLSLIWNIILFFQVKEGTGVLHRRLSSSFWPLSMSSYSSCGDLSPPPNDADSYSFNTLPSKGRAAARESKYHGKATRTLLQWVQRCTSQFGVEVHDFGKSWRSGLAFLAMIKSINPGLVDLRESLSKEPRQNIERAFKIAHHSLDIPPLLEPEDVTCASPDEQSVITYVSMFLGHYSGSDVDQAMDFDFNIPKIPKFRSLETLADDRDAQVSFTGFEKSNERLLWKQWGRRSSGDLSPASGNMSRELTSKPSTSSRTGQPVGLATTSKSSKKKGRSLSALQPPSPLDAGVVSQEICSWMEKSSDQGYSKPRVDEVHFSLSSEEGIYTVSALDSDEEDAYSYILDLNKDVFQPQMKRQVPRFKEEMVEGRILNGKLGEDGRASERVLAQSEKSKSGVISNKSNFHSSDGKSREMSNNGTVFDKETEDGSRGKQECEEEVVGRGQTESHVTERRETVETANVRQVKYECQGELRKEKLLEAAGWKTESKKKAIEKENLLMKDESRHRNTLNGSDKDRDVMEERDKNQQSVQHRNEFQAPNNNMFMEEVVKEPRQATNNAEGEEKDAADDVEDPSEMSNVEKTNEFMTSVDVQAADLRHEGPEIKRRQNLTETTDRDGERKPEGRVHAARNKRTPSCGAKSQSYSEPGLPGRWSCGVTPVELETLLFLWIFLYCCLILPHVNL